MLRYRWGKRFDFKNQRLGCFIWTVDLASSCGPNHLFPHHPCIFAAYIRAIKGVLNIIIHDRIFIILTLLDKLFHYYMHGLGLSVQSKDPPVSGRMHQSSALNANLVAITLMHLDAQQIITLKCSLVTFQSDPRQNFFKLFRTFPSSDNLLTRMWSAGVWRSLECLSKLLLHSSEASPIPHKGWAG